MAYVCGRRERVHSHCMDVHDLPLSRETSPFQLQTQASAVVCMPATMSTATAVTTTASTSMLTTSRPSEDRLRMSTTADAHFATHDPSAPRPRPLYSLWKERALDRNASAPDRSLAPSTSVSEAFYMQVPSRMAGSSLCPDVR